MTTTINASMKANRQQRISRIFLTAVITLVMIAASLIPAQQVHASGGINWGTPVPITQNGQVVDSITHNGKQVQAIYAPRGNVSNYDCDDTYCCAAFVERFYKTVFGVDVWNLWPGNTPQVSSGSFYKTDSPQVGDIAANPEHWAIVKSVSGGTVYLIEQNAWNKNRDSAMVGRSLTSGSGYWYWRWSGAEAAPKNASDPAPKTDNKGFAYTIGNPDIGSDNAVIRTTFYNPNRIHVTKIGCYLYDAKGNIIKRHTEDCSRPESKFYVWYDINAELGLKLSSNTEYQYKIFILHDGVEYTTKKSTFRTN